MLKLSCPLFSNVSHLTLDFKGLLKHLSLFHAYQPDFKVPYAIDGCSRHFTNLRTYQNHMSSVHNCCKDIESSVHVEQDSSGVIESSSDMNENNSDCDNNDTNIVEENLNTTETSAYSRELLQKSSTLFLLGLKEKYKLTQVSIQGIVDGDTSLTQQNIGFL